jgi:hypothetical protein
MNGASLALVRIIEMKSDIRSVRPEPLAESKIGEMATVSFVSRKILAKPSPKSLCDAFAQKEKGCVDRDPKGAREVETAKNQPFRGRSQKGLEVFMVAAVFLAWEGQVVCFRLTLRHLPGA